MNRLIRILGIDPGLRRTGWGLVESDGNRLLSDMFERSPLFRILVDEVEKSLFQADMEIGAQYAALPGCGLARYRQHQHLRHRL